MTGAMSVFPEPSVPLWDLSSSAAPRWYAAYTCVHHEKRILQQLSERNIDSFVPLYRSVRRWKDRRKELDLVLFPGYVFVRIPLQERLRVLQIPGVVTFVNFNGLPTPLPEGEVEALRKASAHGVFAEPHPYLRTGRRVLIRNGPFTGVEGVLLRKKDKYRFVLSIEMIMRSVAIEMDAVDVEALL
jgi:transcription termination/antitermination protein NusG